VAAADEVEAWLADGTFGLLAFNDHLDDIAGEVVTPHKAAGYAERSGLAVADYRGLLDRVRGQAPAVPGTVRRLAAAARRAGVPMLSHDDPTPEARRAYAAIGCTIAEFPITEAAAAAARAAGHPVVMGAPNVLRGGSHKRVMAAAGMVARGLCTVLASDYYYPAPVQAPFKLAADGVAALPEAWALVSAAPAAAAGLADRGTLAPGRRADLVLVDDTDAALPRVAATLVAGQPVYLGDPALAWAAAAAPPVSAPA
jgi:alpha-D-ribose 1-methylphosphonate 5-triphosphate diphosphatase